MTYNLRSYRRSSTTLINGPAIVVILFFLAFIAVTGTLVASSTASPTTKTCTVTGKDRTMKPKGGSDARIYTAECGTYEVADSFLHSRYNSADVYGRIQPGRYKITSIGWRIPLFSMFPNIMEADPA